MRQFCNFFSVRLLHSFHFNPAFNNIEWRLKDFWKYFLWWWQCFLTAPLLRCHNTRIINRHHNVAQSQLKIILLIPILSVYFIILLSISRLRLMRQDLLRTLNTFTNNRYDFILDQSSPWLGPNWWDTCCCYEVHTISPVLSGSVHGGRTCHLDHLTSSSQHQVLILTLHCNCRHIWRELQQANSLKQPISHGLRKLLAAFFQNWPFTGLPNVKLPDNCIERRKDDCRVTTPW